MMRIHMPIVSMIMRVMHEVRLVHRWLCVRKHLIHGMSTSGQRITTDIRALCRCCVPLQMMHALIVHKIWWETVRDWWWRMFNIWFDFIIWASDMIVMYSLINVLLDFFIVHIVTITICFTRQFCVSVKIIILML